MVGDDVKKPLFQGNMTKDLEQYQFLCEEVWIVKQVQDDDITKGKLAMNFRGQVLDWYMKFLQVPIGNPNNTLAEIRIGLIDEFKKPKLESWYITELKEIKKFPNELVWDFDQRFKI